MQQRLANTELLEILNDFKFEIFLAGLLRHPIPDDVIETHSDFRVIVLANRPGFPFLGNDFFGAMGKSCAYIMV